MKIFPLIFPTAMKCVASIIQSIYLLFACIEIASKILEFFFIKVVEKKSFFIPETYRIMAFNYAQQLIYENQMGYFLAHPVQCLKTVFPTIISRKYTRTYEMLLLRRGLLGTMLRIQ